MTKYEWETELKKNVHRLPADEVKRVLEYYGELFEDMAERGKTEREIISEFGNPVDVADKILSEYDGELSGADDGAKVPTPNETRHIDTEPAQPQAPPRQEEKPYADTQSEKTEKAAQSVTVEKTKSAGRVDPAKLVLFMLINIFTGGAMFIIIGSVWIVLASLTVGGAALVLGGGVSFISSFAVMSVSKGAGFAQLGTSVAMAGIGILLAVGCVMLIILYAKLNKWIFGGIRKLLSVKEG